MTDLRTTGTRPRTAASSSRRQRGGAPARIGVVVVEPRLTEDGGARSTLRLVQQWTRAGVPVELLVLQRARPGNAAPVPPGVRTTHPTRRDHRLRRVLPVALVVLVRLARRADVVVSGRDVGWGLLLSWVAARLARRPFVIVVRSDPGAAMAAWTAPVLRPVVRRAYRGADRLVCITPGLVPAVERLGVRPERTSVALNGVEVDRVVRAGRAAPPALPEGPGPLVVAIGRLQAQKGFDVLLRASARAAAAGHPHRLLVLGEGPERERLERLAADLGTRGSVHLPGFVADPLPVLAAADLYVMSSRYEGFGQSLAEALLLGVPSVATDCVSGPGLLLAGGAHGDLVPVEDADALAGAIARHLAQPARLRAAAERGRVWATEHLGIERAARDVLDVLRDVVDGGAGAAGAPRGSRWRIGVGDRRGGFRGQRRGAVGQR